MRERGDPLIAQATPFASILSMARNSTALVTSNVHPVLVLASEITTEASNSFVTEQATEIGSIAFLQKEALGKIPQHGLVYFVRKRESGFVRERIGIGRDGNADICIPSQKISRYHAFFSVTPENDWTITDANSKNGSRVAGSRLAAGAPCVLRETASITLGGIEFRFYLPEEFIALCRSFL
jgi:hypothetical protein